MLLALLNSIIGVTELTWVLQFVRALAISLRMTSILVVMMQMFESIHMITGESFA